MGCSNELLRIGRFGVLERGAFGKRRSRERDGRRQERTPAIITMGEKVKINHRLKQGPTSKKEVVPGNFIPDERGM